MARYTGMEHSDEVLAIVSRWRDRCLTGDGSMLGEGSVWTPANVDAFQVNFVDNLDEGDGDFLTKLRGQIAGQPMGVIQLAAEALWAVYLFPGRQPGPEVRRKRVQEVWSWSGSSLAGHELLPDEAFAGIARGSAAFTIQLWQQLTFLGRVTAALKRRPEGERAMLTRDGEPFAMAGWLDELVTTSSPSMRHVLLYYCYPDSFERIMSGGDKRLIARKLGKTPSKRLDGRQDMTAVDRELLAIRRRKAEEIGSEEIDFYRPPLRDLWQDAKPPPDGGDDEEDADVALLRRLVVREPDATLEQLAAQVSAVSLSAARIKSIRLEVIATVRAVREEGRWSPDHAAPGGPTGATPAPHEPPQADGDDLADLFMDEAKSAAIMRALRERKNVVLTGAPGVGKTFAARRLARALGAARSAVAEVQFHQAYGYEDFVEGFRPAKEGGFDLRPGALKRLADRAKAHPGPHVIIIDEINRGNVSHILGEALVLLEADKRGSAYALGLAQSGELFWLPDNLHLIGLMNTADRSLAMVDYAIRRRFAFFTVEPAFEAPAFGERLNGAGVSAAMLAHVPAAMAALNKTIRDDVVSLGPGYCIGHSYFLGAGPDGDEEGWLRDIVSTQIGPLLREYWAEDPGTAARGSKPCWRGRDIARPIPVLNLYYMFCYAWDLFEEGAELAAGATDAATLRELVARVTEAAVRKLLRRGLDQGYGERTDSLTSPRGTVDAPGSIPLLARRSPALSCRFDVRTPDIRHNRVLKATLRRLLAVEGMPPPLAARLHSLLPAFAGVGQT